MRSTVTSCILLLMVWGINMASARNKSTITIFTTKTSWNDAYCTCKYNDMDLLMAKTQGTMAVTKIFLQRTLTNNDFWFGLHLDKRIANGYTYKWIDDSALGTWDNWYSTEPDRQSREKCVRIDGNHFSWKTMFCYKQYEFVCQKETGSCTMEVDHTIMSNEPYYNVTATKTECIRICKVQQDNCYGVLFRSPSMCYIYESDDPTDFIHFSQNTFTTDLTTLTYRKVCYNSTIRTSNVPYTDSSDDPRRQCSLTQYPSSSTEPTSPYTARTTAPITSKQQSTSQEQPTPSSPSDLFVTDSTTSTTPEQSPLLIPATSNITSSTITKSTATTTKLSSQTQLTSTSTVPSPQPMSDQASQSQSTPLSVLSTVSKQMSSTSKVETILPETDLRSSTETSSQLSSVASTSTKIINLLSQSPLSTLTTTSERLSSTSKIETISPETDLRVATETTSQLSSVASTSSRIINLLSQSPLSTLSTTSVRVSSTSKIETTETTSQLSSVASTSTKITNLSSPSTTLSMAFEQVSSTSKIDTISPKTDPAVSTPETTSYSSTATNFVSQTSPSNVMHSPTTTLPVSVSQNEEASQTSVVALTTTTKSSTSALTITPQATSSGVPSTTQHTSTASETTYITENMTSTMSLASDTSSATLQNNSTVITTSHPTYQTSPTEYFLRQKICGCPCLRRAKKTAENVEKESDELVEYLSVDKTATVSFQRKRVSAPDDRTSAMTVGTTGVVLICLVFGVVLLLDISQFVMYCWKLKNDPR